MPKYVALLRGIAPMNPAMRNSNLRGVLESLGFTNVQSVISSGNITFESPESDAAALELKLEQAWPAKLGFSSTTIIRSLDELYALQAEKPFKGYTHGNETSLNVTFLKHVSDKKQKIEGDHYKITNVFAKEICVVIDLTATKTPNYMAKAEYIYGKEITTRSWKTITRIIKKLEV